MCRTRDQRLETEPLEACCAFDNEAVASFDITRSKSRRVYWVDPTHPHAQALTKRAFVRLALLFFLSPTRGRLVRGCALSSMPLT